MSVAFQTVADVPLVSTGTYALASGPCVFTAEDLAAAVEAFADPTVPAPRVKLGHDDPRFVEAGLDGEPAFGTVTNMRLSDDGQTIIGDLVDVPEWLAASMQSAFPGRSIEGGKGFTAPSGRQYEFVISALALLGVQWPGVTSLPDLREVLEHNGEPLAVAAAQGASIREPIVANLERQVNAGLDVDLVRRRFVDAVDTGQYETPEGSPPGYMWWPRSLRTEDDGSLVLIADAEGRLYRVPCSVSGVEVNFSPAEEVAEEYVPVAAAADRPRSEVVASWSTRAAARPVTTPATEDDSPMNDEQRRIMAAALGLPEDTAEDRLHEVAAERAAAAAAPPEPDPAAPTTPEPVAAGGEQTQTAAVPEGMVLVDAETLQTLQTGAQAGLDVAARLGVQERDETIRRAIEDEGRIAASARETFEQRWDRDPEGTRTLLTAEVEAGGLPMNVIPVGLREQGRIGDGDGDPSSVEASHDEFMRTHNPQAYARLRARGDQPGRVRVRQEA